MDLISREKAIVQLSHNKTGNDDSDVVIQHDIATVQGVPSAFEGMTNGEVVKAVFPSFTVEVNSDWVACWIDPHETIGFDLDWWNAPYKAESEVAE